MQSAAQPSPDRDATAAPLARARVIRKWLTVGAVIALCGIPFLRSYAHRDRPLDEDEIYWVGQAYYYHLALEQWDWTHPDWQLLPARENPVLGKYVIGLGLRLAGLRVTKPDWLGIFYIIAKDRPNAWGDPQDRAERQAVLDRMTPATRDLALVQGQFEHPIEYATVARAVMLVFGVLAVVLVLMLTALYTRPLIAFLAAAAFALHPAVVAAYMEVGVDILAITFSLLAVVHFVWIERCVWRHSTWPKLGRVLVCAGGGVSLAFAVGSKMNAAIVGFLGALLCVGFIIKCLRHRLREAGDSAATMLCLLLVSLSVFVGLNPGHYPNPAKGVWSAYADQQRSLEVQKGIPAKRHPLRSASERLRAIADLTAFHPVGFGLIVGAFVLQTIVACRPDQRSSIIVLWWLIAFVAVAAWLPFARLRYALPVIAPSVILLAVAGDRLFGRLRRKKPACLTSNAAPVP